MNKQKLKRLEDQTARQLHAEAEGLIELFVDRLEILFTVGEREILLACRPPGNAKFPYKELLGGFWPADLWARITSDPDAADLLNRLDPLYAKLDSMGRL